VRASPSERRGLTILQMVKLVAFFAVALASVAPMLNLWRAGVVSGGTARGLVDVALFEAVVVPLVWVALSVVLVRRGGWRDQLITALLLASVSAALGIAAWLLIIYLPAYCNPNVAPERLLGLASLALHGTVLVTLSAAALYLTMRLRRGAFPGRDVRSRVASDRGLRGSPIDSA
jgi:hypothetical protein